MKASELQTKLQSILTYNDPEVVIGEHWLPERLIATQHKDELLFLEFDNVPDDAEGDDEGRGFLDHEVDMLRERFKKLLEEAGTTDEKTDALLGLFLMGHELSTADVIEVLATE
ncbi:hypothetical protein BCU68_00450 [Vibrio sp. 10N.286.49.B3]|uniref:hypothetical protein n=1 Tax=Vibrio sp. 10N.286.49.B3 TaxID=1880855 RepID=UPI000C8582E3|nr:hypothetical protein [Vibrio sp. 10N.286.49.B3]PMH46554.1 hypothetical protein BCU68_00450 [Vibrio sp. 10N.286.49.B3]